MEVASGLIINDAKIDAKGVGMRTTITLEDNLVQTAKSLSGIEETSTLIKTALTEFVQREAGRRLAALGGTMPDIEYPRRRRPGGGEDENNYPEQ